MAKLEVKVIKVQQMHAHGSFRCYLQIGGIEKELPGVDWEADNIIKSLSLTVEKTERSKRVKVKPTFQHGMEMKPKIYFDIYYS